MKIQVFTISLVVAFAVVSGNILGDILPKNPLEEQIVTFLEKWRSGGVITDLFTLPPIKSISIAEIDTSYKDSQIDIDLKVGEITVTGFDQFLIDGLDATATEELLTITASIITPNVGLSSENYELEGRAFLLFPLRGSGALSIETANNLISLNVNIAATNESSALIDDLSVSFNIGTVSANLEGSSWPINEVLSTNGKSILESYQENLIQAVNDYIVPNANKYLSKISLKELLDIIADISANSTVADN